MQRANKHEGNENKTELKRHSNFITAFVWAFAARNLVAPLARI